MKIRRSIRNACLTMMAGASLLPVQAQAAAPTAGYRQGDCGEFTVAVIPDTQNYTDYRHQKWSGFPFDAVEQFYQQMRWIGDNARSAGGDIVFATHVGDVWQHYSKWMDPAHTARGFKWISNGGSEVAMSPKVHTRGFEIPASALAFEVLAGKLPFSVVPGNHDLDALWTDPANPPDAARNKVGQRHVGGLTGFQSVFSDRSAFFSGQPWYVDSHDGGADSAQIFNAGQCRFLHIGLQYHAPDASLEWASAVLRRFPGLPTIVTTHDYLRRDGTHTVGSSTDNSVLDPQDNNAKMIWDEFVSQNDQIFLVLSGHISGQGYSVARNVKGRPVYQVMADYQARGQTATEAGADGVQIGDGWLRLMKFNLDTDSPTIRVRTWSPHYGKFSTEIPQYAAWYKKADGQDGMSDEEFLKRDDFTITLEGFHKRFGPPPAAAVK